MRLAHEGRIEEASEAATIALSLDGKREVTEAFLSSARGIDASPTLFGEVDVAPAEGLVAQPIQAGALERMRAGANTRAALEAELQERGEREVRHIAVYVHELGLPGGGALIRRLRQAVGSADVARAVDNVIHRKPVRYRRQPVSKDEDLLR